MAAVLVLDDDDRLRAVLRMSLERHGHQVDEAGDGAGGLRAFSEMRHDVILCDIVMPEKEGLETIRGLRKQYGPVRIVAMSGGLRSCPMDVLHTAKLLGAWKTLEKPFSMTEMLQLIDEATQTPCGRPQPKTAKTSMERG